MINGLANDEKWYKKLCGVGGLSPIYYFGGEKGLRKKEKIKFLTKSVENPKFDYPYIDKLDFKLRRDKLYQLKSEILKKESNENIRKIYLDKIAEYLLILDLLEKTRDKRWKEFNSVCDELYGDLREDVFWDLVLRLKKRIFIALNSKEEGDRKKFAERLLSVLPVVPDKFDLFELPSQDLSDRYRSELISKYNLKRLNKSSAKIKAYEVVNFFEKMLSNLQIDGWDVVEDFENISHVMSVSQTKKRIVVPSVRVLEKNELAGKAVHELGTHVLRRFNGDRNRLRILGKGLAGYLRGEEGIACVREQVLKGSICDFASADSYFAIGLARGLDGKSRNFRNVYEMMKIYFRFEKYSDKLTKEEQERIVEDSAWSKCLRTFRGTNCDVSGVCFTKDSLYRIGNIEIWRLLEKDFEMRKYFDVGKFDPSNKDQIRILKKIKVI